MVLLRGVSFSQKNCNLSPNFGSGCIVRLRMLIKNMIIMLIYLKRWQTFLLEQHFLQRKERDKMLKFSQVYER